MASIDDLITQYGSSDSPSGGQSIDDLISQYGQPSKPEAIISAAPEPSMFDALSGFIDQAKSGVPFYDEIQGAAHAVSNYPFSDKDFSALYSEGKNNELLKEQGYALEHNVASPVAKLLGGLAAFGPVGAEGSIPTLASTPLRAAGQGVKAAATIGGISGFSSGSGFIDRLEKGGLGAITAAPFGAITGGVAGTGNKVANSIKDDIANVAQVKALQEGLGADALAANEAAAGRFDPNMNIDSALNAASGVGRKVEQSLDAARGDLADVAFAKARSIPTPAEFNPSLLPELQTPIARRAIRAARTYNPALRDVADTDPNLLQAVLSDLGTQAYKTGGGTGYNIGASKGALEEQISKFNQPLLDARSQFAEGSAPINAFQETRLANLASLNPKNIATTAKNFFNNMTPKQVMDLKNDFITQGADSEWQDLVKASIVQKLSSLKDDVSVADALMGTAANRNILKAALPDAEYLFLDRAYKAARASNAANAFKAQTTTALGGATSWLNALTQSLPFTGRVAARLILAAPKVALSTIPRENTAPELALGLLSGYSQQPKLEGP